MFIRHSRDVHLSQTNSQSECYYPSNPIACKTWSSIAGDLSMGREQKLARQLLSFSAPYPPGQTY
jgi:hypothetical protein